MSGASEYGKGDKTRVSNYRGYWNNWDNIKKLVKHNTYKFRSDNIILVGDTHSTTVARDIINLLPDGSDVLHIGDVGLGFGDESFALKDAETWLGMFNDLCVKLNINLYLTRGNHDRPEVWKFPNLSNVFLLQDGDLNEPKVKHIGRTKSHQPLTRLKSVILCFHMIVLNILTMQLHLYLIITDGMWNEMLHFLKIVLNKDQI